MSCDVPYCAAMSDRRTVCVFLSSSEALLDKYYELARDVAMALAAHDIDVVSGGGSIGMMGVLARETRAAGARTTGVIPRELLNWEVGDTESDELIVTDGMRDRKALMDSHSDGFLALPGGLGTLEELLEVWVGRNLGMHRKPVVVLDPWGDFTPLADFVSGLVASKFVRPQAAQDIVWARSVKTAVAALLGAWNAGEGRGSVTQLGSPGEWLEAD